MNTTSLPTFSIDSLKGQRVRVYWLNGIGDPREFIGKVQSMTNTEYLSVAALTTIDERQISWKLIREIELIETVITYKPIFVAVGEVH
jgi:hypothetical protein